MTFYTIVVYWMSNAQGCPNPIKPNNSYLSEIGKEQLDDFTKYFQRKIPANVFSFFEKRNNIKINFDIILCSNVASSIETAMRLFPKKKIYVAPFLFFNILDNLLTIKQMKEKFNSEFLDCTTLFDDKINVPNYIHFKNNTLPL